ncbi:MAG: SDR family oxidoreductase [Bacteroidales bacterium]|nr:SDR family oxidoreductase [Bacteroidales bacterium]
MNLKLKNKLFIVCGATSGFGGSIAKALINEGANVIAVARSKENIKNLENEFPGKVEGIAKDITQSSTISFLKDKVGDRQLDGILVNAGGPPAKSFVETELKDWDDAYESLLRWKIEITKAFIPKFTKQNYGRFLFVESMSVKQPVENLVLSNSLRLSVVGFVKTLSQEIADRGITLNILAPGYHDTQAMQRLFVKKSQVQNISVEQAGKQFEDEIKMGKMGNPDEFASLAIWLLSPHSRYITGQTISVDGGLIKSVFG